MNNKNKFYGIVKQQVTKKNLDIYNLFKELTHISKNLYNQALYIIRQEYFNNKKYLNYINLDKRLKNDENYKLLQSGCSQQILKIVDQNFKSFFSLLKMKKQGKIKNKINMPKYLDKEGYFKICDAEGMKHIHNLNDNLYWTIPMSKEFLKGGMILYDGSIVQSHERIKIQIPNILKDKNIKQIWIIPKHKGNYFEIQYVYEIKKRVNLKKKNNNLLSIDLGINNLCTCVSYKENDKNKFKSFILDGKKLKSINQFYNKQISKLQQLAAKDSKAPYYTKKMYNITKKRNNRINEIINKTCKYIINYCSKTKGLSELASHCLMNRIDTIILGYNENIKQNINIGKRNNQNFVNIPFYRIKENLRYRSELNNIELVIQEESYTSKANFIKNDYIPIYGKVKLKKDVYDENKKYKFSGSRPNRGKYIFNKTFIKFKVNYINADMNGSLNIMRKYLDKSKVINSLKLVKDFRYILYHRGVLLTPIRIRVK